MVKAIGDNDVSVPLFTFGKVCMTRSLSELTENSAFEPIEYLARHLRGDWGDVCSEDEEANAEALVEGLRIFSVYDISPFSQEKLFIITEADRSVTTLLFANEY